MTGKLEKNETNSRSEIFLFVISVIAFLFFFEAARELLGATYNMNLATLSINISVVAIFAFLSPVVYLFGLGKVRNCVLLRVSGIILAVSRGCMVLGLSSGSYLFFSAVAVISFGILLPVLISVYRKYRVADLVTAAVIGAGADLVFRTLGDTFDITVYGITAQRLTALVVLPLVVVFVAALIWYRAPNLEMRPEPKKALFGVGLGSLGFLYSALLGYPNNVARSIDGSYVLAAVLFGAALGGFLLVFVSTAVNVRKWLTSTGVTMGLLVTLAACILLVFSPVPALSIVLCALALFFMPTLFTATVEYLQDASLKKIAGFMATASVTYVLLILLSVFSLTWAFVPGMQFLRNQMGTILIGAAILSVLGLFASKRGLVLDLSISKVQNRVLTFAGVLIIIGTVSGTALYQANPVPPSGDSLIVMTYNIHQGFNTEGKINPWEILEPIRRVNPDILALQESDMNRVTSANTDIVLWLAHKLDMYVYFGPETKKQIYGVAILSKIPIGYTETYYLKSIEDQRVLIRADIEWSGNTLSVYAVHMGLSEEDLTNQTHEILNILSENPNLKLLMGDLNSLPDSAQIETFTNVLSDAWVSAGHELSDPSGYTYSSLEPEKRIDYILTSQELAAHTTRCEVIRGVHGSDHLPVWTEIVWPS